MRLTQPPGPPGPAYQPDGPWRLRPPAPLRLEGLRPSGPPGPPKLVRPPVRLLRLLGPLRLPGPLGPRPLRSPGPPKLMGPPVRPLRLTGTNETT